MQDEEPSRIQTPWGAAPLVCAPSQGWSCTLRNIPGHQSAPAKCIPGGISLMCLPRLAQGDGFSWPWWLAQSPGWDKVLKRMENHSGSAELVFLPVRTRAEGSSAISRMISVLNVGWLTCTLCSPPLGVQPTSCTAVPTGLILLFPVFWLLWCVGNISQAFHKHCVWALVLPSARTDTATVTQK